MKCLFCGKAKAEVAHLVAGLSEGVTICDECVGQALILLASKGWIPPTIKVRVAFDGNEDAESVARGLGISLTSLRRANYSKIAEVCRNTPGACFCGVPITETDGRM